MCVTVSCVFEHLGRWHKIFSYVGLVLFSVTGSLLAEMSKGPDGRYPYDPIYVPVFVELLKMFLSCGILLCTEGFKGLYTFSFKQYILFSIPAACYFLSNTCMFFIIADIGVLQYQVLSNMKVIFSAFAMRVFLGRVLSTRQWVALLLLLLGMLSAQWRGETSLVLRTRMRGYLLVIITSIASSVGGVFSEKLLKSRVAGNNMHFKNIQLYSWGLFFGVVAVLGVADDAFVSLRGLWSTLVCLMVLTMSMTGITVSFILRYSDSLAKSFVASLAIVVTSLVQICRGIEKFSVNQCISIVLISYGLQMYETRVK